MRVRKREAKFVSISSFYQSPSINVDLQASPDPSPCTNPEAAQSRSETWSECLHCCLLDSGIDTV